MIPRTTTTSAMTSAMGKERIFLPLLAKDACVLAVFPQHVWPKINVTPLAHSYVHPGDEEDGSSGCKDFGCCGSVSSNAVTVIQTIKVRDQNNKKKGKDRRSRVTQHSVT